ncbi:HU family DNA-binding protein [Polaribacter sp.]|uniref:HU family DNA-binding protein n=1 Tax=Polaribacter sp. TaxID=1920175 RepID=UPI0040475870
MVQLTTIQRPNPKNRDAAKKFYAQVIASGTVDLERLAYLVSNQSSVNEGDCYAVILSLVHNIIDELKQGKIVKIDRLGSFQIAVNAKGVDSAKNVNPSVIKSVRINFRPDKKLQNKLNINTIDFSIK